MDQLFLKRVYNTIRKPSERSSHKSQRNSIKPKSLQNKITAQKQLNKPADRFYWVIN